MDHLVSPSLLAADFGNLQKEVSMVNRSQADWIHLDIMDGVFVPNISFGFPVIEYIRNNAEKPLDIHLTGISRDSMKPVHLFLPCSMKPVFTCIGRYRRSGPSV
jgi:ribulose-phosphate 3-epimerase